MRTVIKMVKPTHQRIFMHKENGISTALKTYLHDYLVVVLLEHTGYKCIRSLNAQIKKMVSEN
ncbi:hypothetical protein ACNR9Q_15060 [Maribacter sp. X9]|uniref:hypothetical protein n=1 Tax=Maribacter sp. X9 TaxID=3402159 RepID=UPI003AF34F83